MTRNSYPSDLPALTSLRFFAAIWVVIYHFVWWFTPPGTPTLTIPFIVEGILGVDFFFLLSGFILTHAHLWQIQTATLDTKQFLVKRLARIYPLHLATMIFFLALVVALHIGKIPLVNPERYDLFQLLLNVFLVQGWQARDAGSWNFPSWSVSAEWFAYLFFPVLSSFILVKLERIRAELLVAGAAATLIVFWAAAPAMLGVSFFDLHSNFGYFRIFPEFILGIALYRLGTERRIPALESRWAVSTLILLALLLAFLRLELLCVLTIAPMILSVAESARRNHHGVLEKPVMVYLGEISYSIYMIHIPVATILLRGTIMVFGSMSNWTLLLEHFPITPVHTLLR